MRTPILHVEVLESNNCLKMIKHLRYVIKYIMYKILEEKLRRKDQIFYLFVS